jgi:hypothetical protein
MLAAGVRVIFTDLQAGSCTMASQTHAWTTQCSSPGDLPIPRFVFAD